MSLLNTIEVPGERPTIATILGEAGLGKTSLAATFPNPIFIRAEDGLQALPKAERPKAFQKVVSVEQLMQQLTALVHEEHEFKTVVVDSVTQLETLFIQHVVANDPNKPKSINQALGGWGAGMAAVASLHGRVRNAATMLNEKGMHVLFLAHADLEAMDLPDCDPYARYSLRLGKHSKTHYIDNLDMVALVKLESMVKHSGDNGKNKVLSTGNRVIAVTSVASSVAKNRYGITQDLRFDKGVNPFIGLIPMLEAPSPAPMSLSETNETNGE